MSAGRSALVASRPLLVCVTGADGAGKSTVIGRVAGRLTGPGRRVVEVTVWDALRARAAPRWSREQIDRRLAGLDPTSRSLLIFLCLHAALAWARERGADLCLLNGYWFKYCATEVAHGGDLRRIASLATVVFPEPAHLFYLRVDPAVAARRKAAFSAYETGFTEPRTAAAFIAFQRRADAVLRRLLRERPCIELDAHAAADALARRIVAEVRGKGRATAPRADP